MSRLRRGAVAELVWLLESMKKIKFSKKNEIFLRIDNLKNSIARFGTVIQQDVVSVDNTSYPIYSIHLGARRNDVPAIAFVGGVHGLEVIGTEVILSYLETLCHLIEWDRTTHAQLENLKIIFYPCVNPGGIALEQRSNPRGVDLMRNAPVDSKSVSRFFLPGGHRLSPKLPWYRGKAGEPMEQENQTLFRVIKEELWDAPFSLIIDFHSGFGMKDRIWFPFANTAGPFPRVPEILLLKKLFDQTYPHNIYSFEPQSSQYMTHGDFWDFVFLSHQKEKPDNVMIPLCLELGSWIWIKKNPRQIFNSLGFFNPIVPHRQQRTLRRHILLLDFFIRATHSAHHWRGLSMKERDRLFLEAQALWY